MHGSTSALKKKILRPKTQTHLRSSMVSGAAKFSAILAQSCHDNARLLTGSDAFSRKYRPIEIREAKASDAHAISEVLEELIATGKRQKSADPAFVLEHYVAHPDRLQCFLAIGEAGEVLGFQSLKVASNGNPYGTATGWGIIGTHIRPSAARLGVGRRLFSATERAAKHAQLPAIEAYIGEHNVAALAYYEAMGFRTHRYCDRAVCKVFPLSEVLPCNG